MYDFNNENRRFFENLNIFQQLRRIRQIDKRDDKWNLKFNLKDFLKFTFIAIKVFTEDLINFYPNIFQFELTLTQPSKIQNNCGA